MRNQKRIAQRQYRKGHRTAAAVSTLVSCLPLILPSSGRAQDVAREGTARPALMDEVVVTARKREEGLQDTPISIAAFSGQSLVDRGITRIEEISDFTPNLILRNDPGAAGSSSAAGVFVRGVGQKEYVATSEAGVGMYVDGVYMARNLGGLLDLADVERIEILRGPQGTLFGRNTIGGAISVTTVKPGPGFSSEALVTYGSDDRIEAIGKLNIPLSDTFYTRFVGGLFKQDGYVLRTNEDRLTGDSDRITGRFAARWLASDRFTVDMNFDITRARENGVPAVVRGAVFDSQIFNPEGLPLVPPGFPLNPDGTPAAPLPPGVPDLGRYYAPQIPFDLPLDRFTIQHNYITTFFGGQDCLGFFVPYEQGAQGNQNNPACYGNQYFNEDQKINQGTAPTYSNYTIWGGGLNLAWESEHLTVRSITAYREVDSDYAREDDGSPLLIAEFQGEMRQKQFSQEIQLLGQAFDTRLHWILGGYYLMENANNPEPVRLVPIDLIATRGPIRNRSYAAFGQGTYSLTEELDITAGFRITADRKSYTPDQIITENRTGDPSFDPGTRLVPNEKGKQTDTEFTPMVNLSYNWTNDVMTYATFSRGFKSGGFAPRIFPPVDSVDTLKYGPETVTSYEVGWKLSGFDRRLRVNGALYYSDYKDIQVQVFRAVAPVIDNGGKARIQGFELEMIANPLPGMVIESGVGLVDAKFKEIDPGAIELTLDSKFERVPKWNVNASISQEIHVPGTGMFTPRVDWAYSSGYYNDARNTEALRQPGYHMLNLSVNWDIGDNDRFSLMARVANVLDETIVTGYLSPTGVFVVFPNRGREWSLTLRAGF